MNRAQEKSQRLLQIEQLLWAHPEGLTRAEIARRLGVNRSTITKYLDAGQLPPGIYEAEDGSNRLVMDKDADLTKASFSLHEVMAIHLATRLLATRSDKQNPHAASALRKLGKALQRLDSNISGHLLRSADVMDEERDFRDPVYLNVLETLTEAWSASRKVKVQHQMENGRVFDYTFSPYFIEPYAVGQTAHVIGWREPPNALRTLKIERIRAAEITRDPYTIPADFDPRSLLRDAWGIWTSDREPVEVVLRFHPRIAMRVCETRWHTSQRIEEQADGYILWRAQVAEPQEMLPWVRGWGADVEVVAPERLRETMSQTATQLTSRYQSEAKTIRLPYQILYAKTDRRNAENVHLLHYHLIDVGQVTLAMWNDVLTDGIRRRLAGMMGLSEADCGRFMAFLAALHDLGKAGPAYQKKYAPDWLRRDLEQAGLGLIGIGDAYEKTFPHGTVTTWALRSLLPKILRLDERFARKIAVALGGHHGSWPVSGAGDHISDSKHPLWEQVRRDLVWEVQAVFSPPKDVTAPSSVQELNTFLTILSGLTSVADWIGSRNEECFDFIQQPMSTRMYAERSAGLAGKGLSDLGWTGWRPSKSERSFAKAFDYLGIESARSLQQAVIDRAVGEMSPTLLILEAPTGVGKTEIALYVAEKWLEANAGRGLYVAMPTQATSNQMYTRVGEFLHHQYPNMAVNYHLVHGQAAWADDLKAQVELQTVGDDGQSHVNAESWFNPRKRTLLAPFGVGTVDQALLSILQTRHFFVRLFGLSHKVVIFDEVHAYDTYMNTLFHRLLTWLNAIGTSVIVLSATLPAQTRRELVKAYTGIELPIQAAAYPTLTLANNERQQTYGLPKPKSHLLALAWHAEQNPDALAAYLRKELLQGGCAAVICNTVGRAQAVYRALRAAKERGELDIEADNLILFHSRFPPVWRKGIEERVRNKFEKAGQRPQRAIVVATQVIEQSLDIDFDLMITDLAPVDLLVQRAGRLHRHSANDGRRYELPRRLTIIEPEARETGIPNFGNDTYVYAEYILLRT